MSTSTPTLNRGQQKSHLPIDPRLLECVATIEPNSAYLSCHSEEKHFLESKCPARSHFGHFSESDRAVCTPQKLVVQYRAMWEAHAPLLRRKASCRIILNTPGSFNVCKCLQCAKVPPMISVISVRERSTNCSCIHRLQALGPIQLNSGGRVNAVKLASLKQHSGNHRVRPFGWCSVSSKLI